jgi:DNA-binding transcriptional MerR regulator
MRGNTTMTTRYTVHELATLAGVSVRTLHHYHQIGLLVPARVGDNGYRYYGNAELVRLQQILFFRELEFPLDRIRVLLDQPGLDAAAAYRDHRRLLVARRAGRPDRRPRPTAPARGRDSHD